MPQRPLCLIVVFLVCQLTSRILVADELVNTEELKKAVWVTDPSHPGSDHPPIGQSLFDALFKSQTHTESYYSIPYPFSQLIDYFNSITMSTDVGPRVPIVLIPLGRSLQRYSATPDFFKFPRELIAPIGELNPQDSPINFPIHNRIFIAHQEKSKQLEIISYNDFAGRFEFQVVDEYAQNANFEVSYASRQLCMGCHQNGGPIFSKSPWDETNFNTEVAKKIADANPETYPNMTSVFSKDAAHFDLATDRANYLGLAQMIWIRGCGQSTPPLLESFQCRAAFLAAMLQFRLSGDLSFNETNKDYQHYFVDGVSTEWSKIWAEGILLPTADIPDVNPLAKSSFVVSQSPLTSRNAKAYWKSPDRILLNGVVRYLSSSITLADIRRIDQLLSDLSQSIDSSYITVKRKCIMTRSSMDPNNNQPKHLKCDYSPNHILRSLELQFGGHDNEITQANISELNLSKTYAARKPFWIQSEHITQHNDSITLYFQNNERAFSTRTINGNKLDNLKVEWDRKHNNALLKQDVSVTIKIIADFHFIHNAMNVLIHENISGKSDTLNSHPFNRDGIVSHLIEQLEQMNRSVK